nr:unnamed protein product [Spirometra erinaceieuropaei]
MSSTSGLPRTKGRQGKNDDFDRGHRTAFVLVDLGGPVVHPADIEAQSFIMRIREVEMGSSRVMEQSEPSGEAPSPPTPFVGQMRRFVFNGIRPFEEDEGGGGKDYILEATASVSGGLKSLLPQTASPGGVGGRSSKHVLSDLLSVVHPVTFKTADCFLVLPTLKLYDAFSLQFSINTRQTDGIILFNSAGETGDFLALELVQGNLALSFDMGHGVHQQTVGDVVMSDGQWHHIRLYRTDVTDTFLTLSIEEESGPPRLFNITIPYRDRARNFNFYEPLYLGGIPVQNVARRREKMISKHGIQGCIGNFGINNNTEIDIFGLAESKFGSNKTTPDCQWQVVPGCFQRPVTAPSCNQDKKRRDYSNGSHDLPYCLNDGVCLQVWTSLRCACELTTFTGKRCHLHLQIEVAPESRELLTINTHRGLFQYTRLPFGVKTAPALFQQTMNEMLSGIPGTAGYLDDIIIVGRSPAKLQDRVCAVLERVQEYGFRLRANKCQFFLDSIKCLGFVFDVTGHHPDPESIRAIQRMPAPKNVSQLRSFLGLISYYSAFLPSLHDVRAPLNRLLQKDAPWCWSPDCEKAFAQLKSMLSSDLLLTHYDPTLPIVVTADASNHGVGAVISHTFTDGSKKAIMHASRTLTPAEKNYGQIEKEALALVFAVKKFHKLLYCRHFTLLTDHKPLLSIFGSKKGIPVYSASRLQRWATILLGYDFDICYCRTTDFGQADALSRLTSSQQEPEEDTVIADISIKDDVRRQLSDAIRGIPVTAADIRRATEQDPVLRQAITYVQTCWPTTVLAGDLRQLFLRRASLSVVDSCLTFADRVVIPSSLRPTVLRQFHAAHPGTSRMKSIARSFNYWPGIDGDIDDLVRRCSRCQQAAKMPPRQPPVHWEPPERPWSRVHIDFAGPLNGVSYLILVDDYPKWPEVAPLNPATASSTIAFLRRIFSQHGLPEVLVSDNGSQFISSTFEDFCRQHNIQHFRSPPYHPQSNGQAERFVDTFKRALLKARGEGTTDEIVQAFLFSYRTTPNPASPGGVSPAEALMGRKLRTTFHALVPTGAQPAQTSPVSRSKLFIGTPVFVRDYRAGFPDWIEATVVSHRGSMLFDVDVGDDIWVRHHNQIRRRHCSNTTGLDSAPSLSLDILLDIFAIPADQSVPESTSAPPSDIPSSVSVTAPVSPGIKPRLRRRTNRVRRSTLPMQISPRQKRY